MVERRDGPVVRPLAYVSGALIPSLTLHHGETRRTVAVSEGRPPVWRTNPWLVLRCNRTRDGEVSLSGRIKPGVGLHFGVIQQRQDRILWARAWESVWAVFSRSGRPAEEQTRVRWRDTLYVMTSTSPLMCDSVNCMTDSPMWPLSAGQLARVVITQRADQQRPLRRACQQPEVTVPASSNVTTYRTPRHSIRVV